MRITADTNVLLRAIVGDDAKQARAAEAALSDADVVALSLPALCEVVWVLTSLYKKTPSAIAAIIRRLVESPSVIVNRPAVASGLELLDAGGDFADGVIAYEGRWLGADIFVSFDKRAVELLEAQGVSAQLLS